MKVIHFQRKPDEGAFSLERVFEDIRSAMPEDIEVNVHINRHLSKGVWHRAIDILNAKKNQGDINHITGDVHFLSYLMNRNRTILTVLDCVTLERLKGIRYWCFWLLWYWLPAKRCAVITVISESTKKELQKHLRSSQYSIEVIHCCVSPEFQLFEKKFNTIKPRILQIGTKINKNIERVAESLAGISCKLIIIGKLSHEQIAVLHEYKSTFESHIGISREALLDQYQQADLVMFASLYEGFGLPILEAQAVGRPIVISNLYSMPEVGGDMACYVDPYDVQTIKAATKKIINDEGYRSHLIANGLSNVQDYKSDVIAKKYANLYKRIYQENER